MKDVLLRYPSFETRKKRRLKWNLPNAFTDQVVKPAFEITDKSSSGIDLSKRRGSILNAGLVRSTLLLSYWHRRHREPTQPIQHSDGLSKILSCYYAGINAGTRRCRGLAISPAASSLVLCSSRLRYGSPQPAAQKYRASACFLLYVWAIYQTTHRHTLMIDASSNELIPSCTNRTSVRP